MSSVAVGVGFSKTRLEALSDGVFAIAMTLLVLELKVPDVQRNAAAADVLRAMRPEAIGYITFALSFALASQFWMLQHVMFHYVRHANRPLAILTLVFLMFVSLLPYSTKMLTTLGLRQPVGQLWYFGNQWVLAALLATQWWLSDRTGNLPGDRRDRERRQFELMTLAQPIFLLIPLAMAFINPRQAYNALIVAFVLSAVLARRLSARAAAP